MPICFFFVKEDIQPQKLIMIIYKNPNQEDSTTLKLNDKELELVFYLLEKSHQAVKDKVKNSISTNMYKEIYSFIN
jgi:hypothetical protein